MCSTNLPNAVLCLLVSWNPFAHQLHLWLRRDLSNKTNSSLVYSIGSSCKYLHSVTIGALNLWLNIRKLSWKNSSLITTSKCKLVLWTSFCTFEFSNAWVFMAWTNSWSCTIDVNFELVPIFNNSSCGTEHNNWKHKYVSKMNCSKCKKHFKTHTANGGQTADRSKFQCNFPISIGSLIGSSETWLHGHVRGVPIQRIACIKNDFCHWMVPKITLYIHRWLITSIELETYERKALKICKKRN